MSESLSSISKVAWRLRQLDMIEASRGRIGYVRLSPRSYEASVGWLLSEIETTNCSDGILKTAYDAFLKKLKSTKIKHIIADPTLWSVS